MKSAVTLLPALATTLITSSLAQAAETPSSSPAVVVTATRMAQTTDQSLVPVSVITQEQIERSPAQTLPELLGQLPGVDLSTGGSHGKAANLYLRGTNSSHTLVLIDGVRVGSATLGTTPFEDLPLDQIERIELVRGPRSSLYGSEAIGGVLQIFTKRPQAGVSANAKVGAGSYNTRQVGAGLGVANEQVGARINLSHFTSDGIDTKPGLDNDRDGYRNSSASLALDASLNESTRLELSALRTQAMNQYDRSTPPFNDYSDKMQQTLAARLNSDLNEQLSLSAGVSQHRDESEVYDSFPGQFRTKRYGADLKGDLFINDEQIATLGVDYQQDKVGGSSAYLKDSRDNKALFGQWQAGLGNWNLLAGLRRDDNEAFGNKNTGNLNLGYQLDPQRRLLVSYGTAFKAPTFNDLYWPATSFAAGNPNLKPESSKSTELGYEFNGKLGGYALRTYQTEIDDLIDWACTLNCDDGMWWTDFWQPSNVNMARIRGIELEGRFEQNDWFSRASISWLDPRNRLTDKILAKRARRTLQLDLGRQLNAWTLSANLLAQSERFSDAANTAKLPGYGVVNLRAQYALAEHWQIEAKLNNLLDKRYATNSDTNSLGRNYLLSLSYHR